MAEELWDTLMRFHREVTVTSIIEPIRAETRAFRDAVNAHFGDLQAPG